MKQTTRWSPDTCSCVLEYEWDDAVPINSRVHNFKTVVNKCPAHFTLAGQGIYNQVLLENTRKNKVLGIAQRVNSEIKNENYNWSFNDKRILKIGFLDIPVSGADKTQIRNRIKEEIGEELVEVT